MQPETTQEVSRARTTDYTLVHISDPHISRQFYREHIASLKILLGHIVDEGFDHLVISGDLVSTGDLDDYYLVRAILAHHGLLSSERLTVVPGNHDIFGGPHRAVDVLSFPTHIRSVDYRRNLDLFEQVFKETFAGAKRLSGESLFPFLKEAGPFALVGLNSIPPWSLRENPLGTNGRLSDDQVLALERLADSSQLSGHVPVAVLHHHFNDVTADDAPTNSLWKRVESRTMRMRKRQKLLRIFRRLGVRYALHGHIHRNELYERQGISLANGAGSVCDDPLPFLKYNKLVLRSGQTELSTEVLPVPYQESSLLRSRVRGTKSCPLPELKARPALTLP